MSNDTVIKIENLSKEYQLGVVGTGTLSHDLNRIWAKLRGKEDPFLKIGESNDRTTKGNSDLVWALKDINLEVKRGECLGIIGKNGAGKSTLLKILSKITGPTTGCIKIKGRIGSLLEVGTGFHPEMTGRENIYMNGTILGMSHKEVSKKLDEIIDFAGVERYIDTPVKRYSSGMMVRLGFAVAAYLEPDILVVDEVLAVGDAEFQKKCLGKMKKVSEEGGRTVLFVSHNMGAIRQLCSRSICLENGVIQNIGGSDQVINCYIHNCSYKQVHEVSFEEFPEKPACILRAIVTSSDKSLKGLFDINGQIEIRIEYILHKKMSGVNLGIMIAREWVPVFTSYDIDVETHLFISRKAGRYQTRIQIPAHLLKAGTYTVLIGLGRPGIGAIDTKVDALVFNISDDREDTTCKGYNVSRAGLLALSLPWNTEQI